jgi:hypothetical protein
LFDLTNQKDHLMVDKKTTNQVGHGQILVQQVGWLSSKGIDIHPWGSSINSHKDMGCGR